MSVLRQGARSQRGFAMITVALLLIVMVTVGVFMATRSSVQHLSVGLSIRTIQAWFAAQSGLEWAVAQATSDQASHDALCDDGGTINTTFMLTGGAADGYDILITCNDSGGYQEGGVNFEVDQITVTATQATPGDVTFARRTIEAVVTTGDVLPP